MINYVNGDLITMAKDNQFDAIAHGCNCFCTQGSGIAAAMREYTNDECIKVDIRNGRVGDINKLGTFSKCMSPNEIDVYNLYTQYTVSGMHDNHSGVFVHWDMFLNSMLMMMNDLIDTHEKIEFDIGIPLIGCGLAGGDRQDFEKKVKLFDNIASSIGVDLTITVVEFQ